MSNDNKEITGNIGEWSEIYTLLKLLGEGKVYAGDQNLEKIKNLVYPIIMIIRQEKEGVYDYLVSNADIVIQKADGTELLRNISDALPLTMEPQKKSVGIMSPPLVGIRMFGVTLRHNFFGMQKLVHEN